MTTHVKTYEQVGKKEVVADFISNLSPTKTPFQSMIGTESVKSTVYQWLEDSLRDVAVNAQVEGFDPTDESKSQPSLRTNTTQIFGTSFRVSGTADVINLYGRAKETAYQMMKTSEEIKRDLEHALVGTAQTKVDGDASTARKFAGVQAMIHADTTETADGGSGAADALDETYVLNALKKVYDEGAEVDTLMIKPSDALKVANFAFRAAPSTNVQERSRQLTGSERKIVNVIDVYVSPWGEVRTVMNRWLKSTDALLLDSSNWKLMILRPWFKEVLAKTGDSVRHMIVGEFGLKHKNYLASGLITNLT